MKGPRHAKNRDANEAALIKHLKSRGCSVCRMDQPMDLLIGHRGRTFIAEVKNPETYKQAGSKNERDTGFTPEQRQFIQEFQGIPHVLMTETDCDIMLGWYTIAEKL